MPDLTYEIKYKTARSGGKGGQNVNKVETMVEGYWHVGSSGVVTELQKNLIREKLANKINADGCLLVKSQTERSQLANKAEVTKKIRALVEKALIVPKRRRPTKVPKEVKEKRLESKKIVAAVKQGRRKLTGDE